MKLRKNVKLPTENLKKKEREIFVFGSNLSGIHGAGAARFALDNKGAVWGKGVGLFGDSYAIPTKDEEIETLPIEKIQLFVDEFKEFAEKNSTMRFMVTAIGCGLAGYEPEDIAPLFYGSPKNCVLPRKFRAFVTPPGLEPIDYEYWES